MAVFDTIQETLEGYAQKVLEKRLYFFVDSKTHYEKILKLLLGDSSKHGYHFNIACRMLAEEFYIDSQKLLTFKVSRSDLGMNLDTVVSLHEREEEVRKALEKLNYKIETP